MLNQSDWLGIIVCRLRESGDPYSRAGGYESPLSRGRQLRGMRRSTGFGMVTRFWCCFSVPPACETSTAAFPDKALAHLRPTPVGRIEAALMNIAQKSTFVLNQRDLLGI